MNKALALVFVFIVLSSLMVINVKPVAAQATFKPAIPEFTVKFVDYSYDVLPSTTTTINQYTGEKNTTTTPGYRVENKTIEVVIESQPFTPYTDTNRITYYLYYTAQSKGYFGEDWQVWGSTVQIKNPYGGGFVGSTSEYSQGSILSGTAKYDAGAQVDFRVEAIIGHYVPDSPDHMFPQYWFETDVSSGWSRVQTFTMPGESSSQLSSQTATQPTTANNNQPQLPNQTQPPSNIFNPYFLLWIGTIIIASIVITVVVVILRRHPKTTNTQPQQAETPLTHQNQRMLIT